MRERGKGWFNRVGIGTCGVCSRMGSRMVSLIEEASDESIERERMTINYLRLSDYRIEYSLRLLSGREEWGGGEEGRNGGGR